MRFAGTRVAASLPPCFDPRRTTDSGRIGRHRTDMAKRAAMGRKVSCEDCFFHRNTLCALGLDEPCATFRPDRPEGLRPPRQPVLLMRTPRWANRLEPTRL